MFIDISMVVFIYCLWFIDDIWWCVDLLYHRSWDWIWWFENSTMVDIIVDWIFLFDSSHSATQSKISHSEENEIVRWIISENRCWVWWLCFHFCVEIRTKTKKQVKWSMKMMLSWVLMKIIFIRSKFVDCCVKKRSDRVCCRMNLHLYVDLIVESIVYIVTKWYGHVNNDWKKWRCGQLFVNWWSIWYFCHFFILSLIRIWIINHLIKWNISESSFSIQERSIVILVKYVDVWIEMKCWFVC